MDCFWVDCEPHPRCCQLSPYECTTPSYLHLLPPQFHPTQPPLSHCCTMPDPISCLRCTNYCLQCSGATSAPVPGRSKNICQQCDSAGLDCCLFPPGIRLINPRTSVRCYSCAEHHMKCIFLNATDSQCTRCSKQHLTCCFKLSGKYMMIYYFIFIYLIVCFCQRLLLMLIIISLVRLLIITIRSRSAKWYC